MSTMENKNTEEKEAILRSIDDEFFKYYYEYNDEQSTQNNFNIEYYMK